MAKNKIKKDHRKTLITIIILLIAFGIFYVWGAIHYQRDCQIDRIVTGLQDPKVDMTKYVTPTNPDIDVTEASLKPLQSYFKNNKAASRQLANNLRKGKDSSQIKLEESGNHFLIFPKYTIRVAVFRPQVETNHSKSILTVNNKNYGEMEGADQNFYQDLGLVFPGRYHLMVNTKVQGRKLKADSVVNIWSNKTVNMTIKTGTFQIRSVPNGIVYINDRKAKKLDKYGQALFKNYPLAKGMELYIQSSYNGKKIRSYKVKDLSTSIESEFSKSDDEISDYGNAPSFEGNEKDDVYQDIEGDYIVNPLWPGLITNEEAKQILQSNYQKPDEDSFVKGKDNKEFEKFVKQVKKFKKGKKKLKLTVKVTKVLPAGDNYSQVSYQLVYKWKHGHKKIRKIFNYQDALFHKVKDNQMIENLGIEEK